MLLNFDRGLDVSRPVSVPDAIARGKTVVNGPVRFVMLSFNIGALLALNTSLLLAFILLVSGPLVPWVWWSYAAPRWRAWAISRGADPDQLQTAAVRAKLLWPRGHFFEKTEFPLKRPNA